MHMNIRLSLCFTALGSLMILGAGCREAPVANPEPINPPEQASSSTTTILVSTEDANKYCNGADMDSEGYRKTITQEKTIDLPAANLTQAELIKTIILAAITGNCRTALQELDFELRDGTIHIPPIEGWAGVSIAMCSCRPQVETNLLYSFGVKEVVWD